MLHFCTWCFISAPGAATLQLVLHLCSWLVLDLCSFCCISSVDAVSLQLVLHPCSRCISVIGAAFLQLASSAADICSWCYISAAGAASSAGAASLHLVLHLPNAASLHLVLHLCSWCCISAAGYQLVLYSMYLTKAL